MEKLYYSKGVSKAALIGAVISIVFGIILGIFLFTEAGSTIEGKRQKVTIGGLGGNTTYYTPKYDKYDSETQDTLCAFAAVMIVASLFESLNLVLRMRSWAEIYPDSIKANTMGKDISCRIDDITSVSFNKIAGMVALEGPAGKNRLIVQDPEKVQNLIRDLMYKKVSSASSPATASHPQQTVMYQSVSHEQPDDTLL